ncbi:MAG: hypothetical protein A4E42_01266 [Methanoregulaceae archaeon PtaU1.Bin222]|nr:MAG: hypothetical protein A4E42_01266 [Methanoregulaceae archaeon PtaU1.Bin222]
MDPELIQIFELLVALAATIMAYWQRRQKVDAKNETRQVVAFFDPKDESVTTPPGTVPTRSWKMSDETRRWVLVGHDAPNQASLLRQIEDAEKEKLTHYYLTYQDRGGGFYEIEYGLMKGSGVEKPA